MVKRILAFAAATTMVATPCLSAELHDFQDHGARRSGAAVGAYFKVPLGGERDAGKPRAGLRMTMTHDYRTAGAANAPLVTADALDLRLMGDRQATLYLAGQPVTGEEARKSNLGPVSTAVTVVIIAAAVVGGYFILRAIDDSGEE